MVGNGLSSARLAAQWLSGLGLLFSRFFFRIFSCVSFPLGFSSLGIFSSLDMCYSTSPHLTCSIEGLQVSVPPPPPTTLPFNQIWPPCATSLLCCWSSSVHFARSFILLLKLLLLGATFESSPIQVRRRKYSDRAPQPEQIQCASECVGFCSPWNHLHNSLSHDHMSGKYRTRIVGSVTQLFPFSCTVKCIWGCLLGSNPLLLYW